MKNSTKFLDDIMKNSIHQYLVIDVTDKPAFEDWWRFEDECLGEHFGLTRDAGEDWWNTWFNCNNPDNFIMLEISAGGGTYEVFYIKEAKNIAALLGRIDLMIPFSDIYNKYLLKPLPEILNESIEGQAKEFNHQEALQDLLELYNKPKSDLELILEEQLKDAQEEIDSLNLTIKDMEEIIKRYEHNLIFIWTMLEQKIKEK